MKTTGYITDTGLDHRSKKLKITLEVDQKPGEWLDDMISQKKLNIELKPFKKKRSLDANAYFWVLVDKISEATGISKEEIYREQIKLIGGNSEIVCTKGDEAAAKLSAAWKRNGIGWVSESFPSKIEGCTNVILYYGSSTYDSRQMGALIDLAVQDAQALGIETETPEKLALLIQKWGD